MPSRRAIVRLLPLAAALAAGLAPSLATAAAFSGGNVTIVVPGTAGSSFDNAARLLAEPLAREWGVPVVVDNRPGAAGMIAAAHVARAAPDGRTLLLAGTPYLQAPHLVRQPAYDPVASFTPLAQVFDARLWFAASSRVAARTVAEFVALARQPGAGFSFSSPGNGTTPHLNAVLLMRHGRFEMLHVPYKAISPAVMDVATGQVSGVFASYSDLLPHAQAGKLRILASTGSTRSSLSKDVPTFSEQGLAGFDVVGFGGLLAPAGTPAPLATEIAATVRQVAQRPEVRARLFVLGLEPATGSQADFARLIGEQNAFWKKVIVDANVKAD
jgi:tripartite-type tricarboxylate transporter receptor subunit TctC